MSHRILQKYTDVDYSRDMALVALYPPPDSRFSHRQQELVGIAQWIGNGSGADVPEIAFQVRDDWQGEGLGKYLFLCLVEVSTFSGCTAFRADVLADNRAMRRVFEKAGVPYTTKCDFGVVTYQFDLSEKSREESSHAAVC